MVYYLYIICGVLRTYRGIKMLFMKRWFFIVGMSFLIIAVVGLDGTAAARRRTSYDRKERPARKKKKKKVVQQMVLPPIVGPRKTIAVADFENKAGAQARWNLGNGMAEMLTTSLVNTNRFIVVERQNIRGIIQEQDFSVSGRTINVGAPEIGRLLNTQILVSGAITEFSQRFFDSGSLFQYKGVSLGVKSATAHVAINIRMYDTTAGEVIASKRVEGKGNVSGLSIGYSESDWGVDFDNFKASPLGKVTQQAIDEAVYYICLEMQKVSWQGTVVTIKGGKIYLNCGANSNVKAGDEFEVYRKGEELIDPDSGLSLGFETKKIGLVKVFEVEDKFSLADSVSGGKFERGNIIKFLLPPPPALEEVIIQ